MNRPKLTPADLEEVDRVLHLADSCRVDQLSGLTHYTNIKTNAIHRAAEILGISTEREESDAVAEDN